MGLQTAVISGGTNGGAPGEVRLEVLPHRRTTWWNCGPQASKATTLSKHWAGSLPLLSQSLPVPLGIYHEIITINSARMKYGFASF